MLGYISSFMPQYSNVDALNNATIGSFQGLYDSAKSDIIGTTIGPENYTQIYGGTAAPTTTKITDPNVQSIIDKIWGDNK